MLKIMNNTSLIGCDFYSEFSMICNNVHSSDKLSKSFLIIPNINCILRLLETDRVSF